MFNLLIEDFKLVMLCAMIGATILVAKITAAKGTSRRALSRRSETST